MKKAFVLSLSLLLLFLCACGSTEAAPFFTEKEEVVPAASSRTMILTHSYSEDSPVHTTAVELGRLLGEKTDIALEIYPNNTLGNVSTGNDAVTKGTVDMRIGGSGNAVLTILSWLPAMEDVSPETIQQAIQPGGELYTLLEEEYAARGLHLLGAMKPVYRLLTCNRRIESINDFAGIRLRLVGGDTDNAYWKALGALPDSSYQVEEVYTALQMGLIDAEENPLTTICDQKFYEQQDYLVMLHFRVQINIVFMNQGCWNSLTPEEQDWVQHAVQEAIAAGDSQAERQKGEATALVEREMTVITLPEEEEARIRRTAGRAVRSVIEEQCGSDLVERILNNVDLASGVRDENG